MEQNNHCEGLQMIPLVSPDLVSAAVELACYFCTVIGMALTFFLVPRR
jgi:hypothetical protein